MTEEPMFKFYCITCKEYVEWDKFTVDYDFFTAKAGDTKRVKCTKCYDKEENKNEKGL